MSRIACSIFEDNCKNGSGYAILEQIEGKIDLIRFSSNFCNHFTGGSFDKTSGATQLLDELESEDSGTLRSTLTSESNSRAE